MTLAQILDRWADALEKATALDAPADLLAKVSDTVFASRKATDLASGTAVGHSVHPLLVALPIGSWSAAVVFDAVGDQDGARRLIGIGLLSALPTALTGLSDWSYTSEGERRVGLVHAGLNYLAIGAYAASWFARRGGHNGLGIGLSAVGGTVLTGAGWLGGHLSYALGVGVDTTAFQHSPEDWTPVGPAADVLAGQATAGDVGGVPIALTRDPLGHIVAVADRCTHRGGPLSEGEMRDGCFTCPWHGSEFALDGSVVAGPATRPQPAYEVQVRDGQVFARRAEETRGLRKNIAGV
ncbi:MAG: hypothetical protein JWP61_427 [Friedmanniella sp.]|nr:hypothetical protein [Friedmanniella sp.]